MMKYRIEMTCHARLAAALAVALLAGLSGPNASRHLYAQPADEAAAAAPSAPAAEQPASKPRPRRLPTYYSRVVTQQQREQIYEIQNTFQDQIDKLLEQVKTLEQQRDMQVHDVLTPEQQKQVAQMMEEAKKRRAALRGGTPATPAAEPSAAASE